MIETFLLICWRLTKSLSAIATTQLIPHYPLHMCLSHHLCQAGTLTLVGTYKPPNHKEITVRVFYPPRVYFARYLRDVTQRTRSAEFGLLEGKTNIKRALCSTRLFSLMAEERVLSGMSSFGRDFKKA